MTDSMPQPAGNPNQWITIGGREFYCGTSTNHTSFEEEQIQLRRLRMKYRVIILSAILVLAAVGLALAANVDGKWVAQVPGQGGNTREVTFNFKAEGDKLTGTMSGRQGQPDVQIADGTVKGDDISFTQTFNAQGNTVKLVYKGKVSGDEIKFTRTVEGMDRPPSEFTAKRVK
jgi:hypothetical protein